MMSTVDLLNMYKEEKTLIIGSPETRTGLEPFPTFAEWKAEYIKEYYETHETIDEQLADEFFDRIIEEAEVAIEQFENRTAEDVVNEAVAEEVVVSPKMSKSAHAKTIFNEMYTLVVAGQAKRKDVIERFVNEVGLTQSGASTYYQKFKSEE